MKKAFVFIDFDGVICDSLEESYHSSYFAYKGEKIGPRDPGHGPNVAEYKSAFWDCRPFVRSGEDFVVLHQLLNDGRKPNTQAAFDAELKQLGASALSDLKASLTAVREALLIHHRSLWMSWNPLYEGMKDSLLRISSNPHVYILSTKKAEFIIDILAYHGVVFPTKRILEAQNQRKLDIIHQIAGDEPSFFIDDQIEHFDFNHPTCKCLLALWGYVNFDNVGDETPRLSRSEAIKLISKWAI